MLLLTHYKRQLKFKKKISIFNVGFKMYDAYVKYIYFASKVQEIWRHYNNSVFIRR